MTAVVELKNASEVKPEIDFDFVNEVFSNINKFIKSHPINFPIHMVVYDKRAGTEAYMVKKLADAGYKLGYETSADKTRSIFIA